MKKLNNHGLTAVEVLICFSITAVIVISLFKIINNFNEKQTIESRKNLIETYKNTVTKTIMDDILQAGGVFSIYMDKEPVLTSTGDLEVEWYLKNTNIGKLTIHYDHPGEEYISYENYTPANFPAPEITYLNEKFPLSDIPGVEFNEPKIDYDEDNGLLRIYVGIIDSDLDLGDKYEVLDITIPLTEKWNFDEMS